MMLMQSAALACMELSEVENTAESVLQKGKNFCEHLERMAGGLTFRSK